MLKHQHIRVNQAAVKLLSQNMSIPENRHDAAIPHGSTHDMQSCVSFKPLMSVNLFGFCKCRATLPVGYRSTAAGYVDWF
jgi:hypothetical protein